MPKVSKLVYLVAMDIGSKAYLLKLDLHPEARERGEQNAKEGDASCRDLDLRTISGIP